MNSCWHCNKKFKFWEVWRSYWKGWNIKCSSCFKRQTVDFSKRFFINSLISVFPIILLFSSGYFFPAIDFSYRLIGFLILEFSLSLFVPLFKIYGD